MKIKAIIIEGELPESCNKCPYAIYDNDSDGYICMAKVISEYDNLIDDMNIRQSWCPLELDTDYKFRIINRRNQALGLPDDDGL